MFSGKIATTMILNVEKNIGGHLLQQLKIYRPKTGEGTLGQGQRQLPRTHTPNIPNRPLDRIL